jgi:spore coat protein CotH
LDDVGVRSRGRGSRSPIKPNLRIDFNRFEEKQTFLGLKSTTLKANNQDASMLRERLSMILFDRMGIPAPREAYARLYINGQFVGLYSLVESIDKDFLTRTLGEDAGYLYDWKPEATGTGYRFQFLGDDPALYSPVMFDPVTHEKDPDPAPLVDMIRAVNQSSNEDFAGMVSRYVDVPRFLTFLAAESYLADFDGFLGAPFGMNNFYVYRYAGRTEHLFMPWDKDGTLKDVDRLTIEEIADNVLSRRLLEVPEFAEFFAQELIRATDLAGSVLPAELDRMHDQVADIARNDPFKQCEVSGIQVACGAAEFEEAVEETRAFLQNRAAVVSSHAAKIASRGH